MEPAAIAGLAALLGLVVGRFWDSHFEARRWRRDQRIRVYEQFADAYYGSREACQVVALLPPGTPEAERAAVSALELGVNFNRTLIALWLHASVPIVSAGHLVDVELNKLFTIARAREFTWDDWRAVRGPAERAMERFTEAVRGELGLAEVPITIHIDDLPYQQEQSKAP
jgi:hypothetical protein